MINVQFNAKKMVVTMELTLAALLLEKGYHHPYFAVAINRKFIPRQLYAETIFQEGDVIEIISPMQGG